MLSFSPVRRRRQASRRKPRSEEKPCKMVRSRSILLVTDTPSISSTSEPGFTPRRAASEPAFTATTNGLSWNRSTVTPGVLAGTAG